MSPNLFAGFQEDRSVARLLARLAPALAALVLVATSRPARAQMGPGQPGPSGQVGGEEETKPEGAAEKAPPEAGQLPTTPYLPPWPGDKKKAFQLIELDGYYRFRTYWFDNFHLGFKDLGSGTPFPEPLSCQQGSSKSGCSGSIGSANMRLRLEPTINLSEKVAVHMQVDVLDNVVLGSTPEGFNLDGTRPRADVPTGAFSDNQDVPGTNNSKGEAIRVKRAWGEVTLPLGILKFGRMPSQFGLGVYHNGGGEDPLKGTYCTDCDGGDTVDRLYYSAGIPGTGLKAALAMDWASSEPTSGQIGRQDLQPYDLDDSDDVTQWTFVISDLKSPEEWKESVDAGELSIEWGFHFTYRKQAWEVLDDGDATTPLQASYKQRGSTAYVPDGYFRLGFKKLNVEAELVSVLGSIDHVDDLVGTDKSMSILQLGGVGKLNYLLADDDLDLGFEVGFASGDDWDAPKQGNVHYTQVPVLPGKAADPSLQDTTLSAFLFDPNYHVDLILFRRLLGTVRNATYLKPSVSYNLTGRVKFTASAIFSFANKSVSTPGNGSLWGIELDGDLGYHNDREGFFAGISYGALFPLDAMDHPAGAGLGYLSSGGVSETGSASTAQTIQTRLVLKF
jgi:uncharacterized protein (TIGR04551 family)